MSRKFLRKSVLIEIMVIAFCTSYSYSQTIKANDASASIAQHFSQLKGTETLQLVASVPLAFVTHHTQGLTRVDAFYFMSSVKVNRWPKKYASPVDGFDRDNGDGIGYLFKFNEDGKLLDSIRLGVNEVYHPGGIDYDGRYIWVPVCEYRPFGKSILYRVDPATMQAIAMANIPDAIGAVAYNRQANELVGMNWGSRTFYRWKVNSASNKSQLTLLNEKGSINPHFYVDYQDCNYAGNGKMICSGLRAYKNPKGDVVRLGGLELIDMDHYQAGLQLPVNEFTASGTVLTNNPFYIDVADGRLQYYFVPEDDQSTLYIYRLR